MRDGQTYTFIALFAIVAFLTVIPLFFVLLSSFWSTNIGAAGRLTLGNYLTAYSNKLTYTAILNTFIYAVGATLEATSIGLPFAWLVIRTDTPLSRFFEFAAIIPYMIPGILYAIAWVFLLNPSSGAIPSLMAQLPGLGKIQHFDLYSLAGMIFVDGMTGVPLVVIIVSAALKNQDVSLEESAAISGSSSLKIFRTITLPLIIPALLAAVSLNLLRYLDLFEVPAIIGLPGGIYTLSTLIYGSIASSSPNFGYAAVLGVVSILVSGVFLIGYRRSTRNAERFATVAGKGTRVDRINLRNWRWASFAFCVGVLVVTVVLPVIALLLGAVLPTWGALSTESVARALAHSTLSHFSYALSFGIVQRAFINSFTLAVSGSTLAMVLTFFLGYILVTGTGVRGKGILEGLAFTPFAVPGIVMALGMLNAYAVLPLPILGTIWALLLAYITKFMPFGVRSTTSTLIQQHKELQEASRVAGATWSQTIRRVVAPLMRSGFVAGWVLLFIIFMREFSSSILLYHYGTEVLSVVVYSLIFSLQWEAASAIGIIMVTIILVMSYVAHRVTASYDRVGVT